MSDSSAAPRPAMLSELRAIKNLSITRSDTSLLGGAKKFPVTIRTRLYTKTVIIRNLIQRTNWFKYASTFPCLA